MSISKLSKTNITPPYLNPSCACHNSIVLIMESLLYGTEMDKLKCQNPYEHSHNP